MESIIQTYLASANERRRREAAEVEEAEEKRRRKELAQSREWELEEAAHRRRIREICHAEAYYRYDGACQRYGGSASSPYGGPSVACPGPHGYHGPPRESYPHHHAQPGRGMTGAYGFIATPDMLDQLVRAYGYHRVSRRSGRPTSGGRTGRYCRDYVDAEKRLDDDDDSE